MAGSPNPIDKINYIVRFFIDPCDAPLTVWAETALPALLDAFITLYAIDFNEVFQQAYRTAIAPNRRRSQRKGRPGSKSGRNKWLKAAGGVASFDPNEEIGKTLGKFFKLPVGLSGLGATLWVATGIVERALFYVFLAELILETFFKWVSLMEKTEFCQAARDNVLLVTEPDEGLFAIQGLRRFSLFNIEKIRGPFSWFAGGGGAGFSPFTLAFGTKIELVLGTGVSQSDVILQLMCAYDGVDHVVAQGTHNLKAGIPITIGLSGEVPKNASFWVQGQLQSGFAELTDLKVYAFGTQPLEV